MSKNTHSSLYDTQGLRLYLTADEREAFLKAAMDSDRPTRTFCRTLHITGMRISEALALTPKRIDFSSRVVVVGTLKKRRTGVYRSIPVPEDYLDAMDMVHGLKEKKGGRTKPLWPWSRMTAYRKVVSVMLYAGIEEGPHCSPKGLRHAYGVHAVLNNVPLNTLKKWMGHATIETTAIYAEVVGEEEREMAARMWSK